MYGNRWNLKFSMENVLEQGSVETPLMALMNQTRAKTKNK